MIEAMDTDTVSNGFHYNVKVIAASLAMLCVVIVSMFALHIYVKWFRRLSAGRHEQAALRRRSSHGDIEAARGPSSSPGLDGAVVDGLPIFVYARKEEEGEGEEEEEEERLECAVCLCELRDGETGRLLPRCCHRFHAACVDTWLRSHATCPLCRASADPRQQPAVNTGIAQQPAVTRPVTDAADEEDAGEDDQEEAEEGRLDGSDAAAASGGADPATSDRLTTPGGGQQLPANVLFWGGPAAHFASCVTRPSPHIALDIPSDGPDEPPALHGPKSRMTSIKKPLRLSTERKAFPPSEAGVGTSFSDGVLSSSW